MGLRIDRKQDVRTVHACTHNLADIPNGVTVASADLIPGGVLKEGTPIGKDEAGLYHVVKTAKIAVAGAASATVIKVEKGSHFKKGDVVMLAVGGVASAISAIDNSEATYDAITVGSALGAVAVGDALVQANTSGATAGAFKYKPSALVGDNYTVDELSNHFVAAVTMGQFKEGIIPALSKDIKAALLNINLI